jgi:hypothetical protein
MLVKLFDIAANIALLQDESASCSQKTSKFPGSG